MVEETTIEALKREHGEVHVATVLGHDFVFRVPTMPECERFQDTVARDKSKGVRAVAQLVLDALVYPDKATYAEVVKSRPMLPTTLGGEVLKIAGAVEEIEVKKA